MAAKVRKSKKAAAVPEESKVTKIEIERLRAAAEDINEKLELETPIPTDDPEAIEEALVREGGHGDGFYEGDELEEDTVAVLSELDIVVKEGDAPEADEDEPEAEEDEDEPEAEEVSPPVTAAKAPKAAAAKAPKVTAVPPVKKAKAPKAAVAKTVALSRTEACGSVLAGMRGETVTKDALVNASDKAFVDAGGTSNPKEARGNVQKALMALAAVGFLSVTDDNIVVSKRC